MADYTVTLTSAIDFAPQDEVAEILQNVRTILATRVGSIPLHRDFGISWEAVDKPLPVARTLLKVAVVDAVREFEPRAKVVGVTFDNDADAGHDGLLGLRVVVSIGGDDE